LGRDRPAVLPEPLPGVELQQIQALEDFAPGLAEDLPLLAAEGLGKQVDPGFEDRVRAADDPPALRTRRRGPPGKSLGGSIDRGLGVGRAAAREVAEHLAGVGRVHARLVLAGGRLLPLAADVVLPALVSTRDLHGRDPRSGRHTGTMPRSTDVSSFVA